MHHVTATDRPIHAPQQPTAAAGAELAGLERCTWLIPMGMQLLEERQHAVGRKLKVFLSVEPDAVAVEAQVDLYRITCM